MLSSNTVGVLLPVLVPSASLAALSCGGAGHLDKHYDGDEEGYGRGELDSSGLEKAGKLSSHTGSLLVRREALKRCEGHNCGVMDVADSLYVSHMCAQG